MAKLAYNELKAGTIFVKDGYPFKVLDYSFVRMQQRKPVAQLKIKNLITGKIQEFNAHDNDEFEEAEINNISVKFIYANKNKGEYWFCESNNPKNRFSLKEENLGNLVLYLKPNVEVTAYQFKDKIINIELPIKIDLKVTEAPPALKGNTAQGGNKTVITETGAKVNVPLFIKEGDIIKINTETGEYIERV
jgi:elongation factor P